MTSPRQIVIAGAGGHAIVVIDALIVSGCKPAYIVDDDPMKKGTQVGGVAIHGAMGELSAEDLSASTLVVAIAKNDLRRRVAVALVERGASLCGVRHPSAIISQQATIDPTAQIMAGAIVNAGAVIKAHAVLNSGCIVEHGAWIGEYTHIGPGAVLAGAVVIEEGAFVACGAKVCPFVRIGRWSTLGAGAVALRDVAPATVAVGVPAKPVERRPGS
jgi:acetyltransferase EpsM